MKIAIRPLRNHTSWFVAVCLFSGLSIISQSGCGRRSDRVIVSGKVTFSGQPVNEGEIRFVPINGTSGPLTIAPIAAGAYVANSHEGVPVGQHRVEISKFDSTGFVPAPGAGMPKELLPAKYNSKSQLTLTIDGSNRSQTADYLLDP
ncbi:MAG: hypothetical protein IT427_12135 [Pirellulales bacterium]|nr:hypothetical protein [Pirellulales bacterium]